MSRATVTRNYSFLLISRKGKSKMAFWAVSNCDTPIHREQYVKKLQEYTKVDIFSNKGCLNSKKNYTCPLEKAPVHNHNNPTLRSLLSVLFY